jgi:hypothetical protein
MILASFIMSLVSLILTLGIVGILGIVFYKLRGYAKLFQI